MLVGTKAREIFMIKILKEIRKVLFLLEGASIIGERELYNKNLKS